MMHLNKFIPASLKSFLTWMKYIVIYKMWCIETVLHPILVMWCSLPHRPFRVYFRCCSYTAEHLTDPTAPRKANSSPPQKKQSYLFWIPNTFMVPFCFVFGCFVCVLLLFVIVGFFLFFGVFFLINLKLDFENQCGNLQFTQDCMHAKNMSIW